MKKQKMDLKYHLFLMKMNILNLIYYQKNIFMIIKMKFPQLKQQKSIGKKKNLKIKNI